MDKNCYANLEGKISIKFKDLDLVRRAFIHRSFVNEAKEENIRHNERLEFLGDAVLELVVTKHLFEKYPDQDEGKMTAYRSALVKGKHLAEIARELSLGSYLHLSKGEEKSGGRDKNALLANVTEALIGAIYLDHNYEVAENFIETFILVKIEDIVEQGLHIDSKSKFQEICQEKEEHTPYYEVLSEEGPDHDKVFTMGAYINGELIATGTGSSKQKAEDQAAQNALKAKGWNQ